MGEVNTPGNFLLDRDKVHLLEIVGLSRGLTNNADPEKVKIIRGDIKNPEIIYINLKDLNALANDRLFLQNNDIVYFTPKRIYNVSEGLRNYTGLIQPALLLMNAAILIFTLK